ncbi:HAMP domain-containing sensor histidine kinase [uncultured Sphingomonas sp.]|uniref:sensor histidine kinase n=1 Tax=uncultured Sphingomonas sp. TaxID=158754 RepID=UPI0025D97CA3|nr:HAMP domain-containing sensor histidine kinase [uncultured Sphingomonas sp.]
MPSDRLRWRDVRATTPFRLTLLLGSVFLAALWVTLATSYFFTAHELTARSDQILFTRAKSLLASTPAALPEHVRAEIANATPGLNYFALLGQDGEQVVGNIALPAPRRIGTPYAVAAVPGVHGPLRVLAVRTMAGETILMGRDISPIRDLRIRLLQILLVSGLGGTAMVVAAAMLLSIGPLRRVRDLERASHVIAAGGLSHRMPVAGRRDELDQFAVTVNLMLDEVAHVVAQVKNATDAIAHDLRTPLTRVRATLHRMRQETQLPEAARGVTERAIEDLDAVVDRFAALLRIAELEASGRRAGMAPVDLHTLLRELGELYEPLAEERGIALATDLRGQPLVVADRELLFEAVGNVLDNAIKFTRSRVTLRLLEREEGPVIEVIDDGPGILAEEREAVLRRFHRASGAAGVEGTGLGLAVVSAIVHLHGFSLAFDDAAPGLIARIALRAPQG